MTAAANLQIDNELKALIDPLLPDELALLEASILAEGCRDPLVVWNGWLLDGHNRYAICTKHGIEFQTFEKTGLRTKTDVKIWMIENQIGKRNTTDFGRTALALKLKPLLEQQAKERKSAVQPKPGEQVGQVRQNSDAPKERTDEAIARKAGVSRDTVRKVEKIIEKATAEVIEKVRIGEMSINAAAKTIDPPKPATKPTPKAVPTPAAGIPEGMVLVNEDTFTELQSNLKETVADNQSLAAVFESDDKLATALAEAKKYREMNRILEERIRGLQNEKNEAIRLVKSLQRKLQSLERSAA
jgi:ParB-like chromosome segregation protein Spo0J